jgi:nucleoside-diphosphate-sugar epimerase
VILVTGATGRVGYHLMELLADAGAEATAMVRVEARGIDLPGTAGHLVASLEDPPPASVLREVTGADPRRIEDWLENARTGFTGPPPDTPPPPF